MMVFLFIAMLRHQALMHFYAECEPYASGGKSIAGLCSKNPSGLSMKPSEATGMTGQSSGRGAWACPNTYQTASDFP